MISITLRSDLIIYVSYIFTVSIFIFSGFLFAEEEAPAGEPATLLEAARPRPDVPGLPRASDVTMRAHARRARAPEAIRDFHVTWLEWTYSNDPDYIRKIRETGAGFGGASHASSYIGDKPQREIWNVRNLDGELVYPTWKRTWDPPQPWGCVNHPEFREGYLRYNKSVIDAGAERLHRDEPQANRQSFDWGGCFCDYCMEGFSGWLDENADTGVLRELGVEDLEGFDYRQYLRERGAPVGDDFRGWPGDELKAYFEQFQVDSSVEFHRWWRRNLNEHAGRRVAVSCNNGARRWSEADQAFDYWIGELHASNATPEYLYKVLKRAQDYGKTQSTTMPLYGTTEVTPEWIRLIRQTMSTLYAMGGHMQMPWDTYLPTSSADRFFGDPADYADLSAFVRAMSLYLDGYVDAAATGGDIKDERWKENEEPVSIVGGDDIYAIARVNPENANAPVVVHLTDWRDEPEPFRVLIRPEAFYGNRPLRFRLWTPAPYDRKAHEAAFDTGDYGDMADERDLKEGYITSVDIPALDPWGMLIIEPVGE